MTKIHRHSRFFACLEGLIALQKALTFAGTADHTNAELANDAEKCFNEANQGYTPDCGIY